RFVLVAASLSVTAVAVGAVHHQGVVRERHLTHRREDGRAFVERLRSAHETTLAASEQSQVPEPSMLEKLVTILQTEGRICDDVVKVDAARARALELVRQRPDSAHSLLLLAEVELSLHRVDAARAALGALPSLRPGTRDEREAER